MKLRFSYPYSGCVGMKKKEKEKEKRTTILWCVPKSVHAKSTLTVLGENNGKSRS